MPNHLKDKKCILCLLIVINNHSVQILPLTQLNTCFIELIQCKKINIHELDLKKKQELKFVTVLTFFLVM